MITELVVTLMLLNRRQSSQDVAWPPGAGRQLITGDPSMGAAA